MDKKSYLLTPIIILIVGIALIVMHSQINVIRWIVILIGCALLIPAIFNLIWIMLRRRRTGSDIREANDGPSIAVSIITGLLGIWIICMPDFFAAFIVYLFAALLVFLAIVDVVLMIKASRPARPPFWFYIVPIAMIVVAIVLLTSPLGTINSTIVLVTGISMAASGLNRLVEMATV